MLASSCFVVYMAPIISCICDTRTQVFVPQITETAASVMKHTKRAVNEY